MKKLMLSLAVMGFMAFATVQAQTPAVPNPEAVEQETSKIDPESLPEEVKEAIKNHEQVKDLKISEAHTMMEENEPLYIVKFENPVAGEEEVKVKFDKMGNEVKETESSL